jgi:PEGA domain-containing protein
MKLTRFQSFALAAALAVAAAPAAAQEREHSRGSSEGHAVQRDRGQTQRAEAPRRMEAPAAERRAETPRVETRPQADSRAVVEPRRDGSNRNVYGGEDYGRAVPRPQVIVPRVERPVVVTRAVRPVIVAPRVYAPKFYYGGYYGYHPGYRPYIFRPWTHLSFGLFIGYPVRYAYSYPYPVPVYGYGAPPAPVYITPTSTAYGGVTLEISPRDADVYVDGQYVGRVQDFDGVGAPLNLMAGRHHVELSATGHAPLAFDVDVIPGQLVPYRGDMQPIP